MKGMYKSSKKPQDRVVIERVRSYIRATNHNKRPETSDQGLIADIDISMIATLDPQAIEYMVRKEYEQVPIEKYRRARKDILKRMFMNKDLYHDDSLKRKLNDNTKRNILSMIRLNRAKVAVGGTFDLLHEGHKALINEAFRATGGYNDGHVLIGLTTDTMASKKHHPIQAFSVRASQIKSFIETHRFRAKWDITPLNDAVGDLGTNPDYDILVASYETEEGARYVNQLRAIHDLAPVIIDLIEPLKDESGERISSTRIRTERG
jgi:pantetheine-phosphate adenylyltransferase